MTLREAILAVSIVNLCGILFLLSIMIRIRR